MNNQNVDNQVKAEIERYEKLFQYEGPGQIVGWERYIEKKQKERENLQPYTTGMIEFDGYVQGFLPGELVVITGLSGNGKTLFTKTLCDKLGQQGYPIAVFSYEVDPYQYFDSFRQNGIKYPFYLPDENRPGSLKWLEDRVIEARVKYDVKFIVLDHLHYIVDMTARHLNQDISDVMRRLKILAMEENLVIFIVCHQKSLQEGKSEPSLYTCRDSSAIPQECDTGIVIHRTSDIVDNKATGTYEGGNCFVKIDKARRAGTYKKKLDYRKEGEWLVPTLDMNGIL